MIRIFLIHILYREVIDDEAKVSRELDRQITAINVL